MSDQKTEQGPVTLRPVGQQVSTAEEERLGLDRMAARADQMERICRGLIKDARIAYVRDKSDLDMRHREEAAKLDVFHVKRMEELEHSLRRIEALRGA